MKEFSIKESLIFGWQKTQQHLGILIGSLLVLIVLFAATSALEEKLPVIGSLVSLAVQTIISMGFVKILLNIVDGKPARFSDLYTTYRPFWKYLILSILYGVIIFVGLLLLIVPGLILAVSLGFGMYLIIDKQLGPIEALQRSWAISAGVRLKLLGLGIISILINMAGALLLGVGLLVTIPLTTIAFVQIYRQLERATPMTTRDIAALRA